MNNDYLISVNKLNNYGEIETLYYGLDAKWGIYFSHENAITLASELIVFLVKDDWAEWRVCKDPWHLKD